jgi:uncharacterized membrane protein
MTETRSGVAGAAAVPAAAWPRWSSVALVVAGVVVILAETTSLLCFVGIFLVAAGAYGLAFRRR